MARHARGSPIGMKLGVRQRACTRAAAQWNASI
ncbi:hypothetical protein M218_10885 [Burkholderia pseudomallei MSHR338]|nr:hypothetical protein M218_10885 [Burkholderia pseudomallei MSHR338]